MVVRIEPLGHFQCRDIQCGIAARETEISCGIRSVPAGHKTGGHGPKHAGHVQHSVIQGKIPGGHIAEPGITLHLPVTLFQFRAGFTGLQQKEFLSRKIRELFSAPGVSRWTGNQECGFSRDAPFKSVERAVPFHVRRERPVTVRVYGVTARTDLSLRETVLPHRGNRGYRDLASPGFRPL